MFAPHREQWGGEKEEEKEENVCARPKESYLGQSPRENTQALGCVLPMIVRLFIHVIADMRS